MPASDLLSEIAAFLQRESISPEEGLACLVQLQRNNHPDRFQDPQAQREAGERFKKATELIQRLRASIERSIAGQLPTTAIERVQTADVDIVRAQLEISTLLQRTVESSDELQSTRFECD